MSDTTGIEWTDATWNPVTGCTKVSPGCDHCYAETFAERFRGTPGHYFERGFDVQLRPDKLNLPLRWRKPRKVFVNSMSDLFHKDVPDEYIANVFAVMALARRHTFQVLTKRHGRMRSVLNDSSFQRHVEVEMHRQKWGSNVDAPSWVWPLPNVWLGVSVENQQWANVRVPALMRTPAAVRFLSCEPLLGPVELHHGLTHCPTHDFSGGFCVGPCADRVRPDWVIVGGESGRGARPMHPDWSFSLRDQCTAAGVPFLFKQWGEWAPTEARGLVLSASNTREVLVGQPLDDLGHRQIMRRVGKGKAGRELDGRTWDEFPAGLSEGTPT
jgi:protein gp37